MKLHDLESSDRDAIAEVIYRHGHIFDAGQLDRLEELFTRDVIYDLTSAGSGVLSGVDEVRRAALKLGSANPLAHHVTNLVFEEVSGGRVTTRCKAIAVMSNGQCRAASYIDTHRRDNGSWRICRRVVVTHKAPLGALGGINSPTEPESRDGC